MANPTDPPPEYSEVQEELPPPYAPPAANAQINTVPFSATGGQSQTQSQSQPQPPHLPQRPTTTSSSNGYPGNSNTTYNGRHLEYPPNFQCRLCHNTGYITSKSGRTRKDCKDCWRDFGRSGRRPQQQQQQRPYRLPPQPYYHQPPPQQQQYYYHQQQAPPPLPARVVPPGDPSLGGRLCDLCYGSGEDSFLFTTTLCGKCNGIGRLFY